jgi:hypothetical protein
VWPETEFDAFNILDANDVLRSLVRETNVFEIDTCDRNLAINPPFVDKEDTASEAEITTEDWLPEIMLPNNADRAQLSHEVSHDSLRPQRFENRGETGYTASGMRSSQEFSLDVYVDGEKITKEAVSTDYPETADVTFKGVKVEGERVQFVHKSKTSEFRRVSVHHKLLVKPQVGSRSDREDDETDYQDELFTDKLIHITRHRTLFYDRISQTNFSSTGTGVTGPDGNTKSGVALTSPLVLGTYTPGVYTCLMWYKTVSMQGIGNVVQIGAITGGWILVYSNTIGLINPVKITSGTIFDFRLYNKILSAGAMADYYLDVTKNAGKAYLPSF